MKVMLYQQMNERSRHICQAMLRGIQNAGDEVNITSMMPGKNAPVADIAVFYGQGGGGTELLRSYVDSGRHVLYIDMGYWNRKTKADMYGGYHKVVLDGTHPGSVQLSRTCREDRFKAQGVEVRTRESGSYEHILLAGLSEKSAIVCGLRPYKWEMETIKRLKQVTKRPIAYRPKPSWKNAKPIPGTIFSSRAQDLNSVLLNAHCVVTHHSNVAVDALAEGIPVYTEYGAAKELCYSMDRLDIIDSQLDAPHITQRQDFLNRLAYCQWNLAEMASGEAWTWYRNLIV